MSSAARPPGLLQWQQVLHQLGQLGHSILQAWQEDVKLTREQEQQQRALQQRAHNTERKELQDTITALKEQLRQQGENSCSVDRLCMQDQVDLEAAYLRVSELVQEADDNDRTITEQTVQLDAATEQVEELQNELQEQRQRVGPLQQQMVSPCSAATVRSDDEQSTV